MKLMTVDIFSSGEEQVAVFDMDDPKSVSDMVDIWTRSSFLSRPTVVAVDEPEHVGDVDWNIPVQYNNNGTQFINRIPVKQAWFIGGQDEEA